MLPKLLCEQLLTRKGWRLTDHTKGLYGCEWWVDECQVRGFGTSPEKAVADALAQEPILVQRYKTTLAVFHP
jgi:hypothetical protein